MIFEPSCYLCRHKVFFKHFLLIEHSSWVSEWVSEREREREVMIFRHNQSFLLQKVFWNILETIDQNNPLVKLGHFWKWQNYWLFIQSNSFSKLADLQEHLIKDLRGRSFRRVKIQFIFRFIWKSGRYKR